MPQQTKIHDNFLKYPELVEARERAENAIIAFDKVGDVRCTNRGYGPYHLCVNVKVNEYPLDCAPEIREDMEERWYDHQLEYFWHIDFDGDCIAPDNCNHEFPKFFGDGRNGGYFCFDGVESKRGGPAFRAYKQESNWHGGSQEPTPEGNIDIALTQYDDVVDPFEWAPDTDDKEVLEEYVQPLIEAYTEMAEVFESATMWAEVVQSQKEYRLRCYTGKEHYALESLADSEMYEFFDFNNCTIVTDGDKTTVSWPQHKRQFKDVGNWVECAEGDEGALEHGTSDKKPPGTNIYKKFVQGEPKVLSFTMPRDELLEQLNEDLADAVRAIRKRALKG